MAHLEKLVFVTITTQILLFCVSLHADDTEDKNAAAQANVLQEGLKTEIKPEVRDIDLLSNSSLNTTTEFNTAEKKLADAKWLKDFRFAIEGVTQLLVGLVGLVGNGLSIAVLYRQDMDLKPVFRQILITLISFDCFCIIFNLLLFCFSHLSDYYIDNVFPYIVPHVLPLAQIALTGRHLRLSLFFKTKKSKYYIYTSALTTNYMYYYLKILLGSIYSTLAVAIERYLSVCHPHFTPSHCAGSFSISGLVIFSIAFNICRFLEFETTYHVQPQCWYNNDIVECPENVLSAGNTTMRVENITRAIPSTTELRKDPLYSQVTMIVMLVVGGVIPLVVLIALNTKIYLAIRERSQRLATMTTRQRRDLAAATVLVGIILVFIVCHSFKFVVNIYEAYLAHFGMDAEKDWAVWMDGVVSFSHLLSTVNSSLNFIIYCYKDAKFRQVLLRMTCPDWEIRRSINSRRANNTAAMVTVPTKATKTTDI